MKGITTSALPAGSDTGAHAVIDLRRKGPVAVINLAVVDAQPIFRRGVAALFSDDPEVRVVAEADDLEALDHELHGQPAHVVLCDLGLTDPDGELAALRLHERHPESQMVVISSVEDDAQLARAVRGGARGYLLRNCTIEELRQAVVAAAHGESILAPGVATRLLDEFASLVRRAEYGPEGLGALSKREREVLGLVAEGLNNRAIAARLFISENTVKNHVRNIHEKLGVHTRMEAVVRAVREGMLKIA